ncbi:MAG: serine/threonine protein kinase [Acidobacteria bacterium]|nr:serine/threonine protein kinase [Acidobacteriota bacterium]
MIRFRPIQPRRKRCYNSRNEKLDLFMPKLFGNRWKVERDLPEGGQAYTYVVRDVTDSNQPLRVLKRLKNPKRIARFKSELDAISLVKHPNIIELVDSDLEHAPPFIVMEYCELGELTFDNVSRFSTIKKLEIFSRICGAIGHCHSMNIIHRDLKPSNILFRGSTDIPVISDFGICLNTESGLERMTEANEQAGSRYFMAPELADGHLNIVTPSCDVYSLGKLLYWMFAGRLFDREKHCNDGWDLRLQISEPEVNWIYDEIFAMTIVEDPSKRFENATLLGSAVESILLRIRKGGRYLDTTVPSDCLFCAIGKYSKTQLLPVIAPMPLNPETRKVEEYELRYGNNLGFAGRDHNLPAANIESGQFMRVLILKCDHCGNVQIFQFEKVGGPWKNIEPQRPA